MRDGDGAIAAYQHAIESAPQFAEAHSRLGNILHARGRREEARACFRQAADSAPDSTLGRLNAVKLLLDDERPDEAETILRQIVADDPSSSEAWRLLGNGLRKIRAVRRGSRVPGTGDCARSPPGRGVPRPRAGQANDRGGSSADWADADAAARRGRH